MWTDFGSHERLEGGETVLHCRDFAGRGVSFLEGTMSKLISTLLILVFCLLAYSAEASVPVVKNGGSRGKVTLPKPSGSYVVGTAVYHWKDKSREEPWTSSTADHRQLMVQIWYPAAKGTIGKKAPYIFERNKLRASLNQYWPDMPEVITASALEIPVSNKESRYPVLVVSHGMNTGRFLYTSISQELASHGYVVASIDHTYWGPGVAFPDGKVVSFDEGMIARDKLGPEEIDQMMVEGITVMSADQAFVLENLKSLNSQTGLFGGRLNLSKVGSIGHSMGGMAATSSCLKYTDFKTCVSLDGVNYFLTGIPNPSPKPFLLLLNSQWGRNAPPKIKKNYLEAWLRPSVAVINGTRHNSYSDRPLIEPPEENEGMLEPVRAYRIITGFTVAFLNRNLKGLKKDYPRFPEMKVVDLRKVRP